MPDPIIDFSKENRQKYKSALHSLIHTRPWYYRAMGYVFGINKNLEAVLVFFNQSLDQKASIYQTLDTIVTSIKKYSASLNDFWCFVLGLESLIEQISVLVEKASAQRIDWAIAQEILDRHDFLNQRPNLLVEHYPCIQEEKKSNASLSLEEEDSAIFSSCKAESSVKTIIFPKLEEHLSHKKDYLDNIPKEEFKKLPYLFERFGRHNQIEARPLVSQGLPMTYANLMHEKKATENYIKKTRDIMINKRNRAQEAWIASFILEQAIQRSADEVSYFPSRHFAYRDAAKDPAELESDLLDGAYLALKHVETALQRFQFLTPKIEIDSERESPRIKLTPL